MVNATQILPFAINSAKGEAAPEELEVLLAYLYIEKKRSSGTYSAYYSGEIGAFAKLYYPLWIIYFGERIALIDPIIRLSSETEYKEPPSIEGFIDRLQAAHSKADTFKNVLAAHQNFFKLSGSKTIQVHGAFKKPDATVMLNHITKWGQKVSSVSRKPVIGDSEYTAVSEAAPLEAAVKVLIDGIEQLKVARSVLKAEIDHHLKRLDSEIEGIRSEYAREIEATREILNQSTERLVKRRDQEIEMIASRFLDIKDTLVSDLSSLTKINPSIIRKEKYPSETDVAFSANRIFDQELIKRLLGDYPARLETIKSGVSRVRYLTDLIEKEKNRQIATIMGIYDELIKAKSRIASDLQIELDIEVEKRLEEINELSELQIAIEEKIDALTKELKLQLDNFEWVLPNSLDISESSLVYVPIYIAHCPNQVKEKNFLICSPGIFDSDLPPAGATYRLEERLKPISPALRNFLEGSLAAKLQKDADLRQQVLLMVKEYNILGSLAGKVSKGLKLAKEGGWISDSLVKAIENLLSKKKSHIETS